MPFHFLIELLDGRDEQTALFVGRSLHALQGPAVAVDGHRAAQAVEGAAAHRVKRNHIQRVALPDGIDGFQSEEIARFAASADGVDVVDAGDVDEVVIKTDALHAVDQIDEGGVFHAGHFGAEHVLQFAIRGFEKHLRGRLHHHHVALFHDAVEIAQVSLFKVGLGESLSELAAVDGDDHLIVDVVTI